MMHFDPNHPQHPVRRHFYAYGPMLSPQRSQTTGAAARGRRARGQLRGTGRTIARAPDETNKTYLTTSASSAPRARRP